jgi:hypothetical protein
MKKNYKTIVPLTKNEKEELREKIEANYKSEYGEYKYYAPQVYVFKDGNIANKTLHISKRAKDHDNRPFFKFRARPVYVGDTQKDLEEVINDWKEEDDWYFSVFSNVPGLVIPKVRYSICKDPFGTENNTVLITTEWIDNIEGDIFRIETEKLYKYLNEYPEFEETITKLIEKFLELSKEDIYPDYLGIDNVAIYTKDGIPNIALIDTHTVWIGKYCSDIVKARLNIAIRRFESFIDNPLDIENVRYLTKEGLIERTS